MFSFSKPRVEKFPLLLMVLFGAQLLIKDFVVSYQHVHVSTKELFFSTRLVNEYMSYSDMELFAIPVAELASQVKVYFSISSDSSACKQSSIEVYYQHGAPPLPPHQTFNNGTYFLKRDFAGNLVLSTDTKEPLLINEAMPGTWYVGVLVPKSNGIKRKAELGFGNSSSDSCSFEVGLRVVITVVDSVPFLPSDGEFITDGLTTGQSIRYYRYQHLNASSYLKVKVSGCFSSQGNSLEKVKFCPISLSVRARALPLEGKSRSIRCPDQGQDFCSVTMPTTEQEMWIYYITTVRLWKAYSVYYNISVTQEGCSRAHLAPPSTELLYEQNILSQMSFDPGCTPVQELFSLSFGKVLNKKFSPTIWNNSISLRGNKPTFFSFKVSPGDVGSMLSVQLTYQNRTRDQVLICLQKDFVPSFYATFDYYSMNCSGQTGTVGTYNRELNINVPFPGEGVWYISLYRRFEEPLFSELAFYAKMQACSADCSSHGTCNINTKPDIVYGTCACDTGYEGWACDKVKDVDLASILLLTLSSVAFLVDAVIAHYKKLLPETLVYLFLLIISILYHLCNSGVFCTMDESFLQTCDLFGILLAVWVTLLVLTNHRAPAFTPTLNMLAVLVLFVSVREADRSILPFVLTVGFGVLLVIGYNVTLWCQKVPTASFSKKRWALFILPATIMILMSFICFSLLETEDNYMYIHSLGHFLLGFGIALLLPNHRPYARRAHYDLTREFDRETTREENSSSHTNLVNEVRHV